MNEQQLAECLNKLGFSTEMVEIPTWRKAQHNRDELTTVVRLHVIDNGEKKPAKDFFEALLDKSLINLMSNNLK